MTDTDSPVWFPSPEQHEPLEQPRMMPDGTPSAVLDTADQSSYPVANGGGEVLADPTSEAGRPVA